MSTIQPEISDKLVQLETQLTQLETNQLQRHTRIESALRMYLRSDEFLDELKQAGLANLWFQQLWKLGS